MKTAYSLKRRMLVMACVMLVVFLGLMGFVLDQAFRRSAEQGVNERLLLQIYGLLAVAELDGSGIVMPSVLQEPDFNQMGTGLYGIIYSSEGDEVWRSHSALDMALGESGFRQIWLTRPPGQPEFGKVVRDDASVLFYLAYRVLWQTNEGREEPYHFVVLQTTDTYEGEISGFRNALWGWLAGVLAAFVILQGWVIGWGLRPLIHLAADLKSIEDGRNDQLTGRYPEELKGVTSNLNILLANERKQGERYRTTLSDLAHSLKTPLAILHGASDVLTRARRDGSDEAVSEAGSIIDEQITRMDEIISWQLERAVVSTPRLARKHVKISPLVEKIVAAMQKIYEEKRMSFEIRVDGTRFFGDERDAMELLGNIIDNACKYGRSRIRITVGESAAEGLVSMVVEDDGPGIRPEMSQSVLGRGERLDSSEPGQGIGLAVVSEIVARYEGTINILQSDLGGARVEILTPSV